MIHVADTLSFGSQHEQFNVSFLNLLQSSSKDEEIVFYGSHSLNAHIKKMLSNLAFEDIEVYTGRGGFKEFWRAYKQFEVLNRIFSKSAITDNSHCYILLVHPLAHFLFKLFFRGNRNIYIVLHGELESVKFNKHFVNKIWGYFLRSALLKKHNKIQYILLGESIYRNLLALLPAIAGQKCVILDHPYPFSQNKIDRHIDSSLVFSCLGTASLQKNTQYFFRLAEIASTKASTRSIKFNICGRVFDNVAPYINDYVNHKGVDKTLQRHEVNELLDESHFAIFYYDNANYSLCPSGAFWDAVNAELPLLYVKNDYFDYYSDLIGPIGLSFDSPESLNDYALRLITDSGYPEQYHEFIKNLKRLKYDYMQEGNLVNQLTSTE